MHTSVNPAHICDAAVGVFIPGNGGISCGLYSLKRTSTTCSVQREMACATVSNRVGIENLCCSNVLLN